MYDDTAATTAGLPLLLLVLLLRFTIRNVSIKRGYSGITPYLLFLGATLKSLRVAGGVSHLGPTAVDF